MQQLYSNAEIVLRLRKAREIGDRVKAMIVERAQRASRQAHLGDLGCQLHNALVSAEYGKPWAEVDYQKARLARHLLEKSFEPGRIVDSYYRRMVGIS